MERRSIYGQWGSGANWLYCHLSLFLAFNKLFCKYSSSCVIPPILFIDQPSQVYFPTQVDTTENFDFKNFSNGSKLDDDMHAVTNLYEQLWHYVEDCKQEFNIEPQIIITDHADKLHLQGVDFEKLVNGRRWRTCGFLQED